jgi:hypothetical protein
MPDSSDYPLLVYRGNYRVTLGASYEGSILSAEMGGGYRRDEVIFPKILTGKLTYEALEKRVWVQPAEGGPPKSRLDYIWDFYCGSKDNANRPFRMRSPRDGKMYLWFFPENGIELEMMNRNLATTGLKVQQVYVKGVATLDDGSLADDGDSPPDV